MNMTQRKLKLHTALFVLLFFHLAYCLTGEEQHKPWSCHTSTKLDITWEWQGYGDAKTIFLFFLFFNEFSVNDSCSYEHYLSSSEKDLNETWTLTFARLVQCSTSWAIRLTGSWSLCGFSFNSIHMFIPKVSSSSQSRGAKNFNSLPKFIRDTKGLSGFKKRIFKNIFNS